ncbi:hypothetical protein LBMAG50_08360 [Phycisphaerae bacterium]|nr:hypothetical protein LBMAG50_08360 [Phycisphaerae bacterium]
MVLVLLMFVASQFAMTASSRLVTPKLAITGNQAIIVIRHGEDLDEWLKTRDAQTTYWKSIAPTWPKYEETPPICNQFMPGTVTHNSVTVDSNVGHGLSPIGESQAKRLQEVLSKILSEATTDQLGPYAPVTRAITINPSISGATANTFDTIYPFLKNDSTFKSSSTDGNRNLLLVDNQTTKTVSPLYPITLSSSTTGAPKLIVANGLQEKINNNTLLPSDGGSTLLCWDGESLWGDDTDGSRRVFNPNSILAQLANQTLSNKMADPTFYNDFYPKKGAIVYIFTKRAGTPTATSPQQKYNMTIYSSYLPLDGSGLGVLTWRGTWNSDNADTMPRTVTSVQLGSNEMPIQK